MQCHTVPSTGSFGGGLSTGLGGLAPPPPPPPPLALSGMVPYSTASMAADYSASVASAYGRHSMAPFNPFSHSRPEELFYGALGRSLQSASGGAHGFRPEENPLTLMPNRNLPMAIGSPYHERFLTISIPITFNSFQFNLVDQSINRLAETGKNSMK